MQLYDLKDRRRRAKREDEWQDKVRAQQEKKWARSDQEFNDKKSLKDFQNKMELQGMLSELFESGNHSIMYSPEFINKINDNYGKEINQGYGKNKRIKSLIPYEQTTDEILGRNQGPTKNKMEPGLLVELEYDDETGQRKSGPWTQNRSNAPDDPVQIFSLDSMIDTFESLRKETAKWPKEERDKIISQMKERMYTMAGDTSLRDTRIKREEADRLYKRERSDTTADRSADHANAKELQGLKDDAAFRRAQIKNSGAGGLKVGDLNKIQDDLTRMIFRDYEDAQGNIMGSSDLDLAERGLRSSAATAWEQSYPGMVDYATTARVTKQALEGIPFTAEQAEEMSEVEWDRLSGGGKVATLPDGTLVKKKDFVKSYKENAPKLAEQAYMAKFQNLMREELARRSSSVDLAERRAATPKANQTDAAWLEQQRQAQESRQPIPIYGPGEKQIADRKIKAEQTAKSILDSVEIPKSGEQIDLILGQGMQALRSGADTQAVVDALRAQGIREDLISGLVSGTTGRQYK